MTMRSRVLWWTSRMTGTAAVIRRRVTVRRESGMLVRRNGRSHSVELQAYRRRQAWWRGKKRPRAVLVPILARVGAAVSGDGPVPSRTRQLEWA